MATAAFPPTPAQGAPAPNPVGTAVSGGQPQVGNIVQRLRTSLQDIVMFTRAISASKPQAAQQIQQGLQLIIGGIKMLSTGQGAPTSPQGQVPAPPPMTQNQSPAPETPEAT